MTDEDKQIELQSMQQQLQLIMLQKQQMRLQSDEMDHALQEIEKAKGETYRLVGPILMQSSKDEIVKDLNERKSSIESRITIMEKQEERLKKQLTDSRNSAERSEHSERR